MFGTAVEVALRGQGAQQRTEARQRGERVQYQKQGSRDEGVEGLRIVRDRRKAGETDAAAAAIIRETVGIIRCNPCRFTLPSLSPSLASGRKPRIFL